jgi:signal transduction histidine kinase
MTIENVSIQVLLSLSAFLGINSLPAPSADWTIEQTWTPTGATTSFKASSTSIPEHCHNHQDDFVDFPMVIQGVHTIRVDGKFLLQTGDPEFRTSQSFYGSPVLSCKNIGEGKRLDWTVNSYTQYFARIDRYPAITNHRPYHNVFAEGLHIIGAGSALILAMVTLTIFLGKAPRALVFSIAISCFGAALYFLGTVSGMLGIQLEMSTAHKIADLGVWCAIAMIVNALKLEGYLSRRFYQFYFVNVIIGCLIILLGSSGDVVQLGTSLPFAASVGMLVLLLFRASQTLRDSRNKRTMLHVLSLLSFVGACFNEMFVVSGIINSSPLMPIGFISGVFFLALAVNEKIIETYKERDFLRSNLEAEVERKTTELTKKTEQLESTMANLKSTQAELVQSAKLASLGTLSAGIAHEINNSLNYVNGALQPLEKIVNKSCSLDDKAKLDKLFGVMKEGLSLTLEIIKSLRNYTGLNQAKFNDVNLRSVAQTSTTILRNKTRGKIEIDVNVPETLTVFGSVVGINQVFMNLISNAIDAMADGGRLTITGQDIDDEWAEIKIQDTGSGMAPEVASRIFEPFFTTKEVGKGTGLGLHIVRGEIDRQIGRIVVQSNVGDGTCFVIRLPLRAAMVQRSAA